MRKHELSLTRVHNPKCLDLLSSWTEDRDTVFTMLCHYDLSSLVDSHTPGLIETTNGSDGFAEIPHCNHSK